MSNTMKGVIHIINRKKNIGKIILDDGRESLVVTLPPTFEAGDRAEVKFQRDDPSGRIINLSIPGDEWNYGFIIVAHEDKPLGSILPTWPRLRNLLLFYDSQLTFDFKKDDLLKRQVKFKIRKSADGRMQARDVQLVDEEESYRCSVPVFGSLETRREKVKSGIVQAIVKDRQEGKSISGRVKFAKPNEWGSVFGFIERDDGEKDVYFKGDAFTRFYDKAPARDDPVDFETVKNSRGVQVKRFCPPSRSVPLPENEQYGFIDSGEGKAKVRFELDDFRHFYEREPEVGDIVDYSRDLVSGRLIFKKDDSETAERIFLRGYLRNSKNSWFCSQTGCKNFVAVEKHTLYYAYTDNQHSAREVYKFNPEILSEVIAAYKDRHIRAEFRLEAVEALLEFNYQDKNITREELLRRQLELLDALTTAALARADYHLALDYESRRQQIAYKPDRLQKFKRLPGKVDLTIFETDSVKAMSGCGEWHLSETAKPVAASDLNNTADTRPYALDPENPAKAVISEVREARWMVDITPPRRVRRLPILETYNLDLTPGAAE